MFIEENLEKISEKFNFTISVFSDFYIWKIKCRLLAELRRLLQGENYEKLGFSKNYNCANEIEITAMGINLDKSEKSNSNENNEAKNIEYMSLPVN